MDKKLGQGDNAPRGWRSYDAMFLAVKQPPLLSSTLPQSLGSQPQKERERWGGSERKRESIGVIFANCTRKGSEHSGLPSTSWQAGAAIPSHGLGVSSAPRATQALPT